MKLNTQYKKIIVSVLGVMSAFYLVKSFYNKKTIKEGLTVNNVEYSILDLFPDQSIWKMDLTENVTVTHDASGRFSLSSTLEAVAAAAGKSFEGSALIKLIKSLEIDDANTPKLEIKMLGLKYTLTKPGSTEIITLMRVFNSVDEWEFFKRDNCTQIEWLLFFTNFMLSDKKTVKEFIGGQGADFPAQFTYDDKIATDSITLKICDNELPKLDELIPNLEEIIDIIIEIINESTELDDDTQEKIIDIYELVAPNLIDFLTGKLFGFIEDYVTLTEEEKQTFYTKFYLSVNSVMVNIIKIQLDTRKDAFLQMLSAVKPISDAARAAGADFSAILISKLNSFYIFSINGIVAQSLKQVNNCLVNNDATFCINTPFTEAAIKSYIDSMLTTAKVDMPDIIKLLFDSDKIISKIDMPKFVKDIYARIPKMNNPLPDINNDIFNRYILFCFISKIESYTEVVPPDDEKTSEIDDILAKNQAMIAELVNALSSAAAPNAVNVNVAAPNAAAAAPNVVIVSGDDENAATPNVNVVAADVKEDKNMIVEEEQEEEEESLITQILKYFLMMLIIILIIGGVVYVVNQNKRVIMQEMNKIINKMKNIIK